MSDPPRVAPMARGDNAVPKARDEEAVPKARDDKGERIAKWLARAGVASRRDA